MRVGLPSIPSFLCRMMLRSKKSSPPLSCLLCQVVLGIIAALVVLSTIAALVGVYKAHVLSSGLTFGTSSGSLSLAALAFNLFLVKKVLESCPCTWGK